MIKLLHPSLMTAGDVSGGGGPFCHCGGCIVGSVGDGREVEIIAFWVDIFVRLIVSPQQFRMVWGL